MLCKNMNKKDKLECDAYDGWMLACSIGGEITNPTKNLLRQLSLV